MIHFAGSVSLKIRRNASKGDSLDRKDAVILIRRLAKINLAIRLTTISSIFMVNEELTNRRSVFGLLAVSQKSAGIYVFKEL